MTQTQKYKLPQWEKSDRIVMADFNDQAAKLEAALTAHDTALAAKADKTTTNSLQTQVNQRATTSALSSAVSQLETKIEAKCRLAAGTYTGDGQKNRIISLGFTPQAVFVMTPTADVVSGSGRCGGLAVTGSCVYQNSSPYNTTVLEVTSGGFIVHETGVYARSNMSGCVYHYFALA